MQIMLAVFAGRIKTTTAKLFPVIVGRVPAAA